MMCTLSENTCETQLHLRHKLLSNQEGPFQNLYMHTLLSMLCINLKGLARRW